MPTAMSLDKLDKQTSSNNKNAGNVFKEKIGIDITLYRLYRGSDESGFQSDRAYSRSV